MTAIVASTRSITLIGSVRYPDIGRMKFLQPNTTYCSDETYQPRFTLYQINVETCISVLCRIKMLPVVGHVHGLRETLRVRAATANVALTLMKYTHAYII